MLQVWKSFYARSDPAKAYSLLSPALILVTLAMLIPLGLMLSFSFFTQVSFTEIDYSFTCLLYTSPSPRDLGKSRMPSSA